MAEVTGTAGAVRRVGPIGVITHCYDGVPYDAYFNHQYCIGHWGQQFELVFIGKSGLDAALARNALAKRAIEKGCTHALWLDEDHLFPKEMLGLLYESWEKAPGGSNRAAMVSGLVCKKGEGFPQICWEVHKCGDGKDQYYAVQLPLDGRVYEVTVPAFGCTLMDLEKLQKLPEPWFRDTCEAGSNGEIVNTRSDINVAMALARIGERNYVDTRVLVGHVLTQYHSIVWPHNAEAMRHLKELEQQSAKLQEGQQGLYYTPW